MNTNKNIKTTEIFFVFIILFLSNLSALFRVIWLIPNLILAKAILMLIFALVAVGILKKRGLLGELVELLKKNWFLFPFMLFALASFFWSIRLDISIYRWVILLSLVFISAYLGLRYSLKQLLTILSAFGLLILFLSTFFVLFLPQFGVMNYYTIQGAWSGIFWHKNHMGIIVAFINIIFLLKTIEVFRTSKTVLLFWGSAYLYSLFFLIKTDSVGAYLSTIFVYGVLAILFIWVKVRHALKAKHYLLFASVVLLVTLLLLLNLDTFFGLFNRQTNLTGRVPLWTYLFQGYFSKKPILGYGFNAFWYIGAHQMDIQQVVGYANSIIISDNGFIDILISNGIIGFSLFALFYLGMWYRSFEVLKKANRAVDLLPITIMAFSFVGNLSWSLLFENESFLMAVMLTLLFASTKATIEVSTHN